MHCNAAVLTVVLGQSEDIEIKTIQTTCSCCYSFVEIHVLHVQMSHFSFFNRTHTPNWNEIKGTNDLNER